jgi:hypothetical protein
MKRLVLLLLLVSAPAWAQTRLTPKEASKETSKQAGKHGEDCAPIGRTEDGKLVYSMKCENLPAPSPPSPQAEAREAPAPAAAAEGEAQRGGLFGWSYDRRPKE